MPAKLMCQSLRSSPVIRQLALGALAACSFLAGCRGSLDSIQVVLDRHERALARLPDHERSQLMPYGSAIVSREVDDLLPAGELDLETARAIAIRANPDIHVAQARLEAARARVAEARAVYYPTVLFTHSLTRTFHTPASRNRLNTLLQPQQVVPTDVDLTTNSLAVTTILNAIRRPLLGYGSPEGNRNPFSEHSSAFTASWTVFDGFVREAQLLAAKHVHQASWASLRDVERLIIQAVDAAYYQIQLAQEQIRIARADEEFSLEQLEETEKLRAAGRATTADVNNFRVRMLAAQANVTTAVGLDQTSRVVLAELMGLVGAVLPPGLEPSRLAEETAEELAVPDPEPWIAQALANRPDLQQLEYLLASEEEQVRAAKGLFMPNLAVSGSWGFDRSHNLAYSVEDQSSAVAMEFRWELFSGGGRRARVRQAESSRAEAAANLNRRRLAIQSEVRTAIIDLQNAQERIRLQRENVETARENRRIVRAAYLAGKETLNRLNETQRDFITAEADLALARIRLREAWSDLYAATGTYRATVDEAPLPLTPPA